MEIKIRPYTAFHTDVDAMIKPATTQAVFRFIYAKYQMRLRKNLPTNDLPLSINRIHECTHVDRETVKSALNSLQKMRLVTIIDGHYTFNGDMYMSLINTFCEIKTSERSKFAKLLCAGDFDKLADFGFELSEGAHSYLLDMGGQPLTEDNCRKSSNTDGNPTMLQEIQQVCGKSYNVAGNPAILTEIQQQINPAILSFTRQISEVVAKNMRKLVENATDLQEIQQLFGEFFDLEADYDEIVELSAIIDKPESSDEEIMALVVALMTKKVAGFPTRGLLEIQQLDQKSCWISDNSNNNKNNKEKITNLDSEKSSFEQVGTSQDSEQEETVDSDIQPINIQGEAARAFALSKKKQHLPFLPVKEVKEYTSDIHNCLDRADKLFIHALWTILGEYFESTTYDEDGKETVVQSKIDGETVYQDRIDIDILTPALNLVQDWIEAGKIENSLTGEIVEVTAEPIPVEDYGLIVSWELKDGNDGKYYEISSSRFRNIFAQEVTSKTSRSHKRRGISSGEDSKDDHQYLQKIMLASSNEELYGKFTDIELVILDFVFEFLKYDEETCRVEGINEKYIDRYVPNSILKGWLMELDQSKTVTLQDIKGVLFARKIDQGGIELRETRMFSADKIRQWNSLHTQESIIDTLDVEKLLNGEE